MKQERIHFYEKQYVLSIIYFTLIRFSRLSNKIEIEEKALLIEKKVKRILPKGECILKFKDTFGISYNR